MAQSLRSLRSKLKFWFVVLSVRSHGEPPGDQACIPTLCLPLGSVQGMSPEGPSVEPSLQAVCKCTCRQLWRWISWSSGNLDSRNLYCDSAGFVLDCGLDLQLVGTLTVCGPDCGSTGFVPDRMTDVVISDLAQPH
jgi:hypothetical protein